MLRRIRTAAALVACAAFIAHGHALAETITILHVNDSHSHLDAVGPKDAGLDGTLGGLAKAATVIQRLQVSEPNSIFLHAGDLFQGDSYFNATLGTVELQRLQQLGLDAMAVGNHELAFTATPLLGALFAAFGDPTFQPPPAFLSANLDLSGLAPLTAFVRPSMVKEVGGLRVGVFGLVTPFAGNLHPEPVAVLGGARTPDGGEDYGALVAIAVDQVAQLRAAGADVVVCLSHLGLTGDEILAASVPGLDAVVGGHDHFALAEPVLVDQGGGKRVPVVQAGEFYEHVGRLRLSVEGGVVRFDDYELVPVGADVARDPLVGGIVKGLQGFIDAAFGGDLFHTAVAFAPRGVSHHAAPGRPQLDTGAGNLVADALRAADPGADCAITVDGFVADDIARGAVVADDLFRLVSDGFDPDAGAAFPGRGFRLFAVGIRGGVLAATLENVLSTGGDFTPQVSGLRVVFDSSRPLGSRLKNVVVGGEALAPARLYTVVVNFGVLQGLKGLGVPVEAERRLDAFEIDALLAYATAHRVLDTAPEGRVLDVGHRR